MTTARIASRLTVAIAALAGVLALVQPVPAYAAHGGGGFHGGGFHGGGFHGGGFHGGGFHGGGFGRFHGGGFHHGGFRHDGFRGRGGWWWGGALGLATAPYLYDWGDYPSYDTYGGSTPYASQYWYYCQNPAGYYPYVGQCSTNWQPVPAG
jgi:hypothetical protein